MCIRDRMRCCGIPFFAIIVHSYPSLNIRIAHEIRRNRRNIEEGKIWRPLRTKENQFRHRKNQDLSKKEESERISSAIRNRKVRFFSHIMRMDNSRLTKWVFSHVHKNKNRNYWLQGVKKDTRWMGITEDIIQDLSLIHI